jgi:hypothetical protein
VAQCPEVRQLQALAAAPAALLLLLLLTLPSADPLRRLHWEPLQLHGPTRAALARAAAAQQLAPAAGTMPTGSTRAPAHLYEDHHFLNVEPCQLDVCTKYDFNGTLHHQQTRASPGAHERRLAAALGRPPQVPGSAAPPVGRR